MRNKETLGAELRKAFDALAARSGQAIIYSSFEDPKEGRKLIRGCGSEVEQLLLNDVQQQEARNALMKLTANGASLLDIAEFMYACTAGWGSSPKHILEVAGFSRHKLKQMARKAQELAEDVKRLNHPGLPGPLAYIYDFYPTEGGSNHLDALHSLFAGLPTALETAAEIIGHWPFPGYDLPHRQYGKHFLLVYFQAYLKRFGGNYDDLSGLMRLMRDVRFAVSPEASKLLKSKKGHEKAAKGFPFAQFASNKGNEDQKKRKKKNRRADIEPLSAKALQMAIERFRKRHPDVGKLIPVQIEKYVKEIHPEHEEGMTFFRAFKHF